MDSNPAKSEKQLKAINQMVIEHLSSLGLTKTVQTLKVSLSLFNPLRMKKGKPSKEVL
jgi:hypothetical protein